MCWACEEEALWLRYQLEMAVERGEIPEGFTPEDFEWAGLPVPPKRAASTGTGSTQAVPLALIPAQAGIQGDSGQSLNGSTGSPLARGRAEDSPVPKSRPPANPFVCDVPDDK